MRLRDQLVSSLSFSRARDMELAWVDGQLMVEDKEEDEEMPEDGADKWVTLLVLSLEKKKTNKIQNTKQKGGKGHEVV